ENYVMEETYDMVFFKISQLIIDKDKELWKSLTSLTYLDFPQIGLPTYVQNERKRVQNATAWFEKIGSFRTPLEKLKCLLRTLKELSDPDLYASTDTLVPLFLMTLIRSKVPHLMANLVYIKVKFTYQNQCLWESIRSGNIALFTQYYHARTFDPRDREGNNALLTACLYGRHKIIKWILEYQGGVKKADRDDMNRTPLMCAIQSRSQVSVDLLLKDSLVISSLNETDSHGDSAMMYTCNIGDINILEKILKYVNPVSASRHPISMETPLHRASQCSSEFILRLLDLGLSPFEKNAKGQTFYHLTQDCELLKLLSKRNQIDWPRLLLDTDQTGQSALMAWADQGRLDLMELASVDTLHKIDHHGRTALHLLAKQSKLIMGDKSLDFIIKKYRYFIHAQDWPEGNTALHLAVQHGQRAMIQALCHHGARFDDLNWKGVQPTTYLSEGNLACFVDGNTIEIIHLFVDFLFLNSEFLLGIKQGRQGTYTWCLTRVNVSDALKMNWVITSRKVGASKETFL
ncbi:ankyrin repeat-containing domain protein, partial [Sporodiniella umbellata]